MIFTQQGQCYWLKVHEIPQGSRNHRGKPIVNLVNLRPDDRIAALVPVREFSADRYLMFATRNGVVKKTVLSAYGNPRVTGINAINILEGDELIDVQLSDSESTVVLATREGMAIRFAETDVREMGRATTGVRGISLQAADVVIGMVVLRPGTTLLVVTENGMGKRSEVDAYRLQRRGGKGVINVRTTDKTGLVVGIKPVVPDDELMLITRNGIVIRQSVNGIRVIGRNTQGVRLINLDAGDVVMDVACMVNEDDIAEVVGDADSESSDGAAGPGDVEELGEGEVQEV
jgi:DNA gyrase subunit A